MTFEEAYAIISRRDQWSTQLYGISTPCQYGKGILSDVHTCKNQATWTRSGTDVHYIEAYYTLQNVFKLTGGIITNFVCDEHVEVIWGFEEPEEVTYPEIDALHELQGVLESLQ